jgi:hypothetical protein
VRKQDTGPEEVRAPSDRGAQRTPGVSIQQAVGQLRADLAFA